MAKFINSNYKPVISYGTTPEIIELRKDDKGKYYHKSILQRKDLPPKKNFKLETLLDAKVDLKKVNTKIFQEKEILFTKPTEQTEIQTDEVNNAK